MKKIIALLILALFCAMLSACGETVSGVGKDASRIGKGVKTIFIREGE